MFKNKIAIVFIISILFMGCEKQEDNPFQESTTEVLRLKDVAGEIWIGMLYDQAYDDIDESIFNREVNAGQVTWYARFSGWNGDFVYDFTELNNEVNYVSNQELPVMMHMLFGPNGYLPEWFKDGSWTHDEMETMMQNLVQNIMESNDNASKVDVWNIVNEAISWDGDEWEDSKWLELGYEADQSGLTGTDRIFDSIPVYISKAFEYARLYTNKELELRDYLNDGLESRWNNSELRTKSFYQLAKHLVNKGVPIDAVGLQGHMNIDVPMTFSKLIQTVQKHKSLGLKVYITELDAEQNNANTAWNSEISRRQANYYYNYVYSALEGGADGIFTWGVRDDQDPWWRFGEHPLLFDVDGNPKDSYYSVKNALIDFNN